MTGGGFGGCIIALVPEGRLPTPVGQAVAAAFAEAGLRGTRVVRGACRRRVRAACRDQGAGPRRDPRGRRRRAPRSTPRTCWGPRRPSRPTRRRPRRSPDASPQPSSDHAWLARSATAWWSATRTDGVQVAPAYRWTCEVSVYVAAGPRSGGGVGRALYAALLERLATRGFRTAVASMTLPNPAARGCTRRSASALRGAQRVGWKAGRWHDVALLQRSLGPDRPGTRHRPNPPDQDGGGLSSDDQGPRRARVQDQHQGQQRDDDHRDGDPGRSAAAEAPADRQHDQLHDDDGGAGPAAAPEQAARRRAEQHGEGDHEERDAHADDRAEEADLEDLGGPEAQGHQALEQRPARQRRSGAGRDRRTGSATPPL